MFGGLWAVTVMDTIQFIVLFFATLILVPLSLQAAGGFSGIAEHAPENLHWFNGPKGAPLWLVVYYAMIVLKYNGNWAFIQRLYAVRDETAARKVASERNASPSQPVASATATASCTRRHGGVRSISCSP